MDAKQAASDRALNDLAKALSRAITAPSQRTAITQFREEISSLLCDADHTKRPARLKERLISLMCLAAVIVAEAHDRHGRR